MLRAYHEYNRTDRALKQQILNSFDRMYTLGLSNIHTGYSGITAYGLIHHLYSIDLDANKQPMKTPAFDAIIPIEVLFEQLETAQEYADVTASPIPETPLIISTLATSFFSKLVTTLMYVTSGTTIHL